MSISLLSDNHYLSLLQRKYSKTFSNMDYKNQNTFRDVVGLAMRAGYEQARLDRIKELSKRNIPLFQWSEDEYDYVGYNCYK